MVKEAASKTAAMAGDGTTTATVLAQAIYNEGLRYLKSGANPVEIKRGMDKAVAAVVGELENMSTPITTTEEVCSVGTISANNDKEIGNLIATAMDRVGKDGVITVEESRTAETSLEVVEGMQFDRGYISPYFVTDQQTMQTTLEDPYILLYDKKITGVKEILSILEQVSKTGKGLLIVCEDLADEALAALIVNKVRGILKVAAVRAPEYGDRRIQALEDLAVLTNGIFVSEQKGMKLDKLTLDKLGKARVVTVTKDKCTIIDGAGETEAIESRIQEIKKQIETATSEYEIEKLQSRLAKLTGGVAVLNIGAHTEAEMKEKKDRVDDALHATKAAVDEGIVMGGGMALALASNVLNTFKAENEDQNIGVQIIKKACKSPFNLIMKNAGKNPEAIMIEMGYYSDIPNVGYDARNDKYVDMISEGIIDPTKVTRTALENANSVASILLTTEAVVTKEPTEKKEVSQPEMMY
jgi:chaperonin GroEL